MNQKSCPQCGSEVYAERLLLCRDTVRCVHPWHDECGKVEALNKPSKFTEDVILPYFLDQIEGVKKVQP